MLKTILCATDFSEHFRFTVDWGIWLSDWFSSRLLVFHAVPSTRDTLYASDATVTGRSIVADLEKTRERLETMMAGRQVDWEPLVSYGDSVETLVPMVESQRIDLVVAASYGMTGIRRVLLGTVVERMARSLNCPLWVVRVNRASVPGREGIRRIVVACDLSEQSASVIEMAAKMAGAFEAELTLVHSMEAPLDEEVAEPTEGPFEEVQQELQKRLRERMERMLSRASNPKVPIDAAVLQGHPGEQIPGYARRRKADLIVVGVRPIGKAKKVLRGSTTELVLRRSHCAVLAVPQDAAAGSRGQDAARSSMSATGIIQDHRCLDHLTDDAHPENARRLAAVYDMLDREKIQERCPRIPIQPADPEDLLLLHAPEYIEKVAATEEWEFGPIGPDTQVSAGSYLAARLAVGGVLGGIREVVEGRLKNALVLVRPPGHHAERSRAMGYCLFNNIALGAAYARQRLGLERVLIVDWDVHHGNGTQHFFERDPTVLFFSIHQYPHFPKTGFFTETGIGPGEGFTINIPLPRGYGDGEYAALMESILAPVAKAFSPDLVLVSAGFDLHRDDPLGGMRLTDTGFAAMTRSLMNISESCCGGKMVLVLEGGYEPRVLAASVLSVIDELTDRTRTDPAAVAATANRRKIRYAVTRCVQVQQRFWGTLTLKGGAS